MKTFNFVILFLFLSGEFSVLANGINDDGWELFRPSQDSGCDRKETGHGVEIQGDFNGDKKKDVAKIQINKKMKKARLVVWLGGQHTPIVIKEWDDLEEDNFVALIEPTIHKTWCGKTGECNPGESKSVELKNQSIAFGTCEASQADYHWNSNAKKFDEDWVSD